MIDLSPFPRVALAHLPTPLERLGRLRAALGPDCPRLYIKRDDCTGLGLGGNKTRKLEFLLGEAQAEGADHVVTFGAVQSNHARQTAAAAARLGLACDLILVDAVARNEPAYRANGNILLDGLFGATVHIVPPERSAATFDRLSATWKRDGRKTYVIPTGGSNATGALGYVAAFGELMTQATDQGLTIDAVVHATSSAGTQAGLLVGAAVLKSETSIVGVNVYKPDVADVRANVATLTGQTLKRFGLLDLLAESITIVDGHLGEAYGVPTSASLDAIRILAQTEGILLDPVYTSKAFAGLLQMIRDDVFTRDQAVVFLHTGGAPALFAYPDVFSAAT